MKIIFVLIIKLRCPRMADIFKIWTQTLFWKLYWFILCFGKLHFFVSEVSATASSCISHWVASPPYQLCVPWYSSPAKYLQWFKHMLVFKLHNENSNLSVLIWGSCQFSDFTDCFVTWENNTFSSLESWIFLGHISSTICSYFICNSIFHLASQYER